MRVLGLWFSSTFRACFYNLPAQLSLRVGGLGGLGHTQGRLLNDAQRGVFKDSGC
jgi:hypothetical protein